MYADAYWSNCTYIERIIFIKKLFNCFIRNYIKILFLNSAYIFTFLEQFPKCSLARLSHFLLLVSISSIAKELWSWWMGCTLRAISFLDGTVINQKIRSARENGVHAACLLPRSSEIGRLSFSWATSPFRQMCVGKLQNPNRKIYGCHIRHWY